MATGGSAQGRVEPPCDVFHRLALARAEIMTGVAHHHEVDVRVAAGDAFEHGERPQLVPLALHDERRTWERGERILVERARPAGRRDRMPQDRERVGWLAG